MSTSLSQRASRRRWAMAKPKWWENILCVAIYLTVVALLIILEMSI